MTSLNDPILGEIKRAGRRWYELTYGGTLFRIAASVEEENQRARIIQVRTLAADLEGRCQRAVEYAATHLLPVKNASWLESGEKAVDASTFTSLLRLKTIEVSTVGIVIYYFDDGGMFGAHSVLVYEDESGALTEAQLAG